MQRSESNTRHATTRSKLCRTSAYESLNPFFYSPCSLPTTFHAFIIIDFSFAIATSTGYLPFSERVVPFPFFFDFIGTAIAEIHCIRAKRTETWKPILKRTHESCASTNSIKVWLPTLVAISVWSFVHESSYFLAEVMIIGLAGQCVTPVTLPHLQRPSVRPVPAPSWLPVPACRAGSHVSVGKTLPDHPSPLVRASTIRSRWLASMIISAASAGSSIGTNRWLWGFLYDPMAPAKRCARASRSDGG